MVIHHVRYATRYLTFDVNGNLGNFSDNLLLVILFIYRLSTGETFQILRSNKYWDDKWVKILSEIDREKPRSLRYSRGS